MTCPVRKPPTKSERSGTRPARTIVGMSIGTWERPETRHRREVTTDSVPRGPSRGHVYVPCGHCVGEKCGVAEIVRILPNAKQRNTSTVRCSLPNVTLYGTVSSGGSETWKGVGHGGAVWHQNRGLQQKSIGISGIVCRVFGSVQPHTNRTAYTYHEILAEVGDKHDVFDKSPCSVGFSPRGSVIIREAWAKAHTTSTSVGNDKHGKLGTWGRHPGWEHGFPLGEGEVLGRVDVPSAPGGTGGH